MTKEVSGKPDFGSVAHAWEKWEEWLEPCYRSFNETILRLAAVTEGHRYLDLGCGSGYPAVLVAQVAGEKGEVIALDIADEMLEVARRRSKNLGLNNIQFQKQDIDSLPFASDSFDGVTGRFCLMFVSNPSKTLKEICRVLKPGGKFVAAVWGDPEKNPLPRSLFQKRFTLPASDPAVPGPFRFSGPGVLTGLMKQAGFSNPTQEEVTVHEIYLSGNQYLEHILEASALWGGLLRQLDKAMQDEVSQELVQEAEKFRTDKGVAIPRTAWIVSGQA